MFQSDVIYSVRFLFVTSDCSSRASFDHLQYWLNEVNTYCTNADAVKMLVANKVDCVGQRSQVADCLAKRVNLTLLFSIGA